MSSRPSPAEAKMKAGKGKSTESMIRSVTSILDHDDKNDSKNEVLKGVLFWVNKSGFPLDEQTWDRMWKHCAMIHPEGQAMVNRIRNKQDLPQVPVPHPPLTFVPLMPVQEKLKKIQDYMIELQYNHTGTQFFEIRKKRPISGLMECAREMMREALPIKCLEAVILGIFLTNGMLGVERFTLSFKTVLRDFLHRHIVLGISYRGCYGAIGMSRRDDLMYKPVEFKSLSELVFDFERCYMKYGHVVKRVKVGLPIIHDQHSYETINWKALVVNFSKSTRQEVTCELDNHARKMKSLGRSWITGPHNFQKMVATTDFVKELSPTQDTPKKTCRTTAQVLKTIVPPKETNTSCCLVAAALDANYQLRA